MNFVPLLKTFEKERGWVKYQIDSYNNFIDFGIQKVMEEIGIIKLTSESGEIKIKFGKVEIGKPVVKEADGSLRVITPNEARVRNLTYLAPIWVDVIQITDSGEERPEKVNVGEIPVMVRSKLCTTSNMAYEDLAKANEDPYDTGGYFIVNGTERVLVLIEEIGSNRPIIEKVGDDVKVRISSEKSGFKQRHVIERKPSGEITISFANVKKLP